MAGRFQSENAADFFEFLGNENVPHPLAGRAASHFHDRFRHDPAHRDAVDYFVFRVFSHKIAAHYRAGKRWRHRPARFVDKNNPVAVAVESGAEIKMAVLDFGR